jgi:isopenicillin N synthase-like dioxygenase
VSVPVIDLGRFRSGAALDRDACARDVGEACREFGFLVLVGHGLSSRVTSEAWEVGVEFFRLPIDERMSVAMPTPGYPYGYSPFAGERLAGSLGVATPPDLKETFSIGPVDPPPRPIEAMDDPDERAVYAANLWPASLSAMRPAWERFYRANGVLAAELMRLFAAALGLSEAYFDRSVDHHGSAMRMAHYPALREPPPDTHLRAGAHTDYGTLTILHVDDEPGLEIQGRAGNWTAVQPVGDGVIVNLGDLMERWTNDRWRSTMHRVVARPEGPTPERWSIPFFHNANWDAVVSCLPTCLAPGETAKHPPVGAGAHLMAKFRSTVVSHGGTGSGDEGKRE